MKTVTSKKTNKLVTRKFATEKSHNLCLTCLEKGDFKVVNNTYYNNKKAENYLEMLSFCYSLQLTPTKKSGTDYYICEKCIAKLRSATMFRRQIEITQTNFKDIFNDNTISNNLSESKQEIDNELDAIADPGIIDKNPETTKVSLNFNNANEFISNDNKLIKENHDCALCKEHFDLLRNHCIELMQHTKTHKTVFESSSLHLQSVVESNEVIEEENSCEPILDNVNYESDFNWSDNGIFSDSEIKIPDDSKIIKNKKHELIPRRDDGLFACKECSYTCSQFYYLIRHQKSHVKERPFLCEICGNEFKSIHHLNKHQLIHSEEKPFKCNMCSFTARIPSTVTGHQKVHNEIKPFVCEKCGASFRRSQHLKNHKIIHEKLKIIKCKDCDFTATSSRSFNHHSQLLGHSFICIYCNETFDHFAKLQTHKKKKHKTTVLSSSFRSSGNQTLHKKFVCGLCDKSFISLPLLKHHIPSHSHERPFSCDICKSTYKRKVDLKSHVIRHCKIKPFKCRLCPFAGVKASDLREHLIWHSDARPYECDICNLAFKKKENFKNHIVIHSDERPFPCTICNFKSKRRLDLKYHMLIHSDVRVSCSICDFTCLHVRMLRRHVKLKHSDGKVNVQISKGNIESDEVENSRNVRLKSSEIEMIIN